MSHWPLPSGSSPYSVGGSRIPYRNFSVERGSDQTNDYAMGNADTETTPLCGDPHPKYSIFTMLHPPPKPVSHKHLMRTCAFALPSANGQTSIPCTTVAGARVTHTPGKTGHSLDEATYCFFLPAMSLLTTTTTLAKRPAAVRRGQ